MITKRPNGTMTWEKEKEKEGCDSGCLTFTTEESRVAIHKVVALATDENIIIIHTWLNRLKEMENHSWKVKKTLFYIAVISTGFVVTFHFFKDIIFTEWVSTAIRSFRQFSK